MQTRGNALHSKAKAHLYSQCQTWINLKTHTVSKTENRTSCLTTVSQTIKLGAGGRPREVLEGGDGTQKFVYHKRPNKKFPIVNFVFSHDGHFGLEGGGGSTGGTPRLLLRCTAILMLPWGDLIKMS